MAFSRPSVYPSPPKFVNVKDAEEYANRLYRALVENDRAGEQMRDRAPSADLKALIVRPEWYGGGPEKSASANSAAMKAAMDSGAAIIKFSSGTYNYDTQWEVDREVRIDGGGFWELQGATLGDSTTKLNYTGTGIGIRLPSPPDGYDRTGIHLSNFVLHGSALATGGIKIGDSPDFGGGLITKSSLTNIGITGFTQSGAYGLALNHCLEMKFENVYAYLNYDGIVALVTDGCVVTMPNFTNCWSRENTNIGWNLTGVFQGGLFLNCLAESNRYEGMVISGAGAAAISFINFWAEGNNIVGGVNDILLTGTGPADLSSYIQFFGGSGLAVTVDYAKFIVFYNSLCDVTLTADAGLVWSKGADGDDAIFIPGGSTTYVTPGNNCISNGGFASATTSWSATDATLASVAGGHIGNCLEITRTGGSFQNAKQTIANLMYGKVYTIVFYVKSGTSGDEAFSVYEGLTTDFNITGTSSSTWTGYSYTFQATVTTPTITLQKDSATAGTMLFDSVILSTGGGAIINPDQGITPADSPTFNTVKLTRLTDGYIPVSSIEEVSNGGFDSATTGWDAGGCTLASVSGGQSGNCLEITRTSGDYQDASQTATGLLVGEVYTFSTYAKSGTSGDEQALLYCFRTSDSGDYHQAGLTTSGSWVKFSLTFTATEASYFICLRKYTATAGTMLFDTASLQTSGFIDSPLSTDGTDIDNSGVYKVDAVQVVGARVVDARCDDAINSGDATTDGVIDALRDAMITHGLIAAA